MPFSPRLLRNLRRLLLGCALFATAAALVITFENWRGHRAWRLYASEQAARGNDLSTLPSPSSLPAASNFMRSPVFDRLFGQAADFATQQEFAAKYGLPQRRQGPSGGAWQEGRRLELAECIYALTTGPKPKPGELTAVPTREMAERLLTLQQPIERLLEELRIAARERPESQLVHRKPMDPLDPFDSRAPSFFYIRHILTAQVWHASASLATGREEAAFYDTLAALRFLRGMEEAPDALLVDTMIGSAGTGLVMQAVWEGLQAGKWSEPQLAMLAGELARADLVASLQRSLHTERVAANLSLDQLGWRDSPAKKVISRSGELKWLPYVPAGWIQQNKKMGNQWLDRIGEFLAAPITPDVVARVRHWGETSAGFGSVWSPYTYWAIHQVIAYDKIIPVVLRSQTLLQLARTACALERHRLAHGQHPQQLAELVPAFLDKVPLDPIGGQPLRYERDDATGHFSLYSIGLDGKDDGGKSQGLQKNTGPGDWIWPQPALESK